MPSRKRFLFRIDFGRQESVAVFNLSNLLFDLNRIYVAGYREVDEDVFKGRPQNRERYRIGEGSEIRVARIRFESPLLVDLINQIGPNAAAFAAISGGVFALAQALERLLLLGPTRRLAIANARKAELEVTQEIDHRQMTSHSGNKLHSQVEETRREIGPLAAKRIEQSPDVQNALHRLRQNPLQPKSIDIRPQQSDRL
jgi:hypothetical protein